MKNILVLTCLSAVVLGGAGCSETLQRRYDQRHGTTSAYSSDSDRYRANTSPDRAGYRRDYNRVNEVSGNNPEFNRDLVLQYEEMDKLGDMILSEIDILDRRWDLLLADYKKAKSRDRNGISEQLDQITEDQLALYKAYTRIYHDGKTNWPTVKTDVENTVRSVRRLDIR